ncbi:MAG TPA: VWA domain-containing protein [Motilibacteraceae bacterium]|nr:VWA domain-containing protein [Motilibacteraceae bacterium]
MSLSSLTFDAPLRLLLLLAVVGLIAVYLLQQRRRTAYAVRFTQLPLLDKVAPRRPAWRRHVPAAAFLAALALLVLAFARPTAETRVPRERATVIVAVDVSLSMEATDVQPTRLQAAQAAAKRFIGQLPDNFRVGLVAFSGAASVVVPPTENHDAVERGVSRLSLGPATGIGEAIYASLDAIRNADAQLDGTNGAPPARIVLLSDGTNTVGRDPLRAAQQAKSEGVPVSTIAYGTQDGVVETQGQQINVPVDVDALREIAQAGGGQAYTAQSSDQLRRVYDDIGSSIGYRLERHEVTTWFVGLALLAALAAAAASLRWFARLP